MEPFPISPVPGSTLAVDNTIGRNELRATAFDRLSAGNNLAINDPRRMGKTTFLRLLCTKPAAGFYAVLIDYEGTDSVEGFLIRTVRGLHRYQGAGGRIAEKLRTFFEGLEVEQEGIKVKPAFAHRPPEDVLETVVDRVADQLDDHRLLIAMDEVPLAIDLIRQNEGPAAALRLMQVLRRLRESHTHIQWIVTGSIGFHHVLHAAGGTEGLVNDLLNLPVGPLAEDDAALLAHCLLLGINRPPTDGVLDAMVRESGAIPFLLHHLAHLLSAGHGNVHVADVRTAFAQFVNDEDQSKGVTHLVTRLSPFYGGHASLAGRILDHIAFAESATFESLREETDGACDLHHDELLRLIGMLRADHYVLRNEHGEITWRYDVLRRIWMQRRQLG